METNHIIELFAEPWFSEFDQDLQCRFIGIFICYMCAQDTVLSPFVGLCMFGTL